RGADRLPPQRLLPRHGHPQGQADPGGHGGTRADAVAAQTRTRRAVGGCRMKALRLGEPGQRLNVLCLGAHSDGIQIGAGASLLQWQAAGAELDVTWCVLSAAGVREGEARASAADFLHGVASSSIEVQGFRDGYFPAQSSEIKAWFEGLKGRVRPDVILTHK